MRIKRGFTLIEIMVSLVVFSMVMTAMVSAFYKTYKDWQRQRDYNLVMDNGRWALEFMSNEIRQGSADSYVTDSGESPLNDHELLSFLIDRSGHGNSNIRDRIYYWRGKTGRGSDFTLYRGVITNGKNKDMGNLGSPYYELSRFVVNGTDIFNVSGCAASNCSVEINLTVRPKPDQPEGPGNRNYTFRTMVRPRS